MLTLSNIPLSHINSGVQNKIIVVLALESLSTQLSGVLGSPVDIGSASSAGGSAPAPQAVTTSAAPQQSNAMHLTPAPAPMSHIDPTTGQTITPIKLLDTYLTRWTIRARCTAKSEMKDYQGERPGHLFSVTLLDESGEIRATLFNEAADKFFPVFAISGMYVISQGKLKFANKKFTSVKHAYELTLNADSMVIPIESIDNVPHIHFEFVPIDNIQDSKKDDMIDVIGVVVQAKPATVIQTKRGDAAKRSLIIGDQSGRTVELTLWGAQASGFDEVLASHGDHPILAVKGAKVSDFGGRSLSCLSTSEFELNPDLPASHMVQQWWNSVPEGGRNLPSLSGGAGGGSGGSGGAAKEKTLSSIVLENLGHNGTADYITVPNMVVTSIKRDATTLWYKACANPDCKGKKVFDEGGGNFKCPTCNGVNNTRLRWVSNFTAFDHTGKEYISGFGEAGTTLLGCEAELVSDLKERGDEVALAKLFDEAKYRCYNMRLAVKSEVYQDTPRTKVSVQSITPIDYVADSERLLDRIADLQRK